MNARPHSATSIVAQFALLLVCLFATTACHPKKPPPRQVYTGPTLPIYDVIASINRNNRAVPTLWARGDFDATLFDEHQRKHSLSGKSTLLYRKPQDLRLVGEMFGVSERVFDIGSNADRYWMIVKPEVDTIWWGRYDAPAPPPEADIPIRPDLLIDVLGVGEIDTNLNALPAPVMRFNNDVDAYMFVWHDKLPDRWVARKEVWYDRSTFRPQLVLLFDDNGRVILRALLDQHRSVDVPDVDEKQRPTIAGRYRLYFPQTGTKLTLTLDDVRPSNAGVPRDASFRFPDPAKAAAKEIPIDASIRAR